MKLTVNAPGKLNLFLHITGRRTDGYHTLQTLFQFVDYCDVLSFSSRSDAIIEVKPDIAGLQPEDNLIYRAASLLQSHSRKPCGVDIQLQKQLPMGGGMGGGSSNAASTLVALNKLWQLGLNKVTLAKIGLSLGADVPVFIHGHAALAEGIGEVLQTVDIAEPWYLIAIPSCHANTAELFQEKQLTRDSKIIRIRDFLKGGSRNDFEPVLRKRFPLIDRCMQMIDCTARNSHDAKGSARVTGSGACLFVECESEPGANRLLLDITRQMDRFQLTNQDVSWKIVKGCNHSPLYTGDLASQG